MDENSNKLGKYALAEQLGSGVFGWVYKATDPIGRTVAVKVLKPGWADDPQTIARFRREAQVAGELFHNRIATIIDFDEYEGRRFLVMRYVDGVSLDKLIQQDGHLSWARTLEILGQAADGLDYAHQRGFVHRDVKPANILISEKDGAVLTDFGLARAAEASGVSSSSVVVGTPQYIAPEIWDEQPATPAADLYSLACVACEMLSGRVLFNGSSVLKVMKMHQDHTPPVPDHWAADVPPGLTLVLFRALQKDPAQRQTSTLAFVAELKNLAERERQQDQARAAAEALEQTRQADAAEKTRKEREQAQADQRAQVEAAEKARQAEAQARLLARFEATEQALRQANEREARVAPPQKSFIEQFWWVGLLGLAGVLALAGLLAIVILGGRLGAAPAPTAVSVAAATDQPALVLANETELPALRPTSTSIPSLGPGSQHLREKDGMVELYVPAGPFTMGSDTGSDDEKPAHKVTLDAFWIDQSEVTNAMFASFVSANAYQTDAEKAGKSFVFNPTSKKWEEVAGADWQHPQGPNSTLDGLSAHPVVHVSWNDASAYCQWVGGQLPSEAQWEKAARGEQDRTYPWGEAAPKGTLLNFADRNLVVDSADKNTDDGYQFTSPVKNYPAGVSPYGAYDMAGNVWEWVADWYDVYPGGDKAAWAYFGTKYRVLRGGSWNNNLDGLRVSVRNWETPDTRYDSNGFRCSR